MKDNDLEARLSALPLKKPSANYLSKARLQTNTGVTTSTHWGATRLNWALGAFLLVSISINLYQFRKENTEPENLASRCELNVRSNPFIPANTLAQNLHSPSTFLQPESQLMFQPQHC